MQIDLFMQHLNSFMDVHAISRDVKDRYNKCREEDAELADAFYSCNIPDFRNEALDRLITALALLDSLGVKDPLHCAYEKLVSVATRPEYQSMREAGK